MTKNCGFKKPFGFFAVILLALLLALSAFAADKTVYLDGAYGDDAYAGTDETSAFKTLDKAINAIADGGTVVLVSDYVISGDYIQPAHSGEIVITSNDGTKDYKAKLDFKVNVNSGTFHRLSSLQQTSTR